MSICILRLINSSVNGNYDTNEIAYVSCGMFDLLHEYLKIGYYDSNRNYLDLKGSEYDHAQMKESFITYDDHQLITHTNRKVFKDNRKIMKLKHEALKAIHSLLTRDTAHQFVKPAIKETLVRIVRLGYIQLRIAKFTDYTTDLFNPNSKI